jgi:hypothetical protein
MEHSLSLMPRKAQAENTVLRVTLPTFAALVLQQRAKDQRVTVSAILEPVILENILLGEVGRMARESPDFARAANDWLRSEVARKK